ncbi:MAG: FMN-binding protein [Actinobacteria bacterium]|nr:FMN-binding protein [Actinomycetota bacterium]
MIRKTALLVTGTIAGVVGVLSYNPPQLNASIAPTGNATQPQNSPSADVGTQASKSPAQPAPTTSTSKKSSTNTTSANSQTTKASASTSPTPNTTTTQSSGVSGTFKGDTSQTRWGPVQVEIVVTNGKITDVKTLQYPNGDRRSQNISSQVIPWLQEETLQVQSANISGISGATYTSGGFQASLASALQKAGL